MSAMCTKKPERPHSKSVSILGALIKALILYVLGVIDKLDYILFNSLATRTNSSDGLTGLDIKSLAPKSKALRTFSSFPAEEIMIMGVWDDRSFLT